MIFCLPLGKSPGKANARFMAQRKYVNKWGGTIEVSEENKMCVLSSVANYFPTTWKAIAPIVAKSCQIMSYAQLHIGDDIVHSCSVNVWLSISWKWLNRND